MQSEVFPPFTILRQLVSSFPLVFATFLHFFLLVRVKRQGLKHPRSLIISRFQVSPTSLSRQTPQGLVDLFVRPASSSNSSIFLCLSSRCSKALILSIHALYSFHVSST
eukprot:g65044.t1